MGAARAGSHRVPLRRALGVSSTLLLALSTVAVLGRHPIGASTAKYGVLFPVALAFAVAFATRRDGLLVDTAALIFGAYVGFVESFALRSWGEPRCAGAGAGEIGCVPPPDPWTVAWAATSPYVSVVPFVCSVGLVLVGLSGISAHVRSQSRDTR